MKILIVEDELPAFHRLEKLLREILPSISLITHFDTIKGTQDWLSQNNKPDIGFFDIHPVSYTHLDVYKRQQLWFA